MHMKIEMDRAREREVKEEGNAVCCVCVSVKETSAESVMRYVSGGVMTFGCKQLLSSPFLKKKCFSSCRFSLKSCT